MQVLKGFWACITCIDLRGRLGENLLGLIQHLVRSLRRDKSCQELLLGNILSDICRGRGCNERPKLIICALRHGVLRTHNRVNGVLLVGCRCNLAIWESSLLALPRVGSHKGLARGDKLRQVTIIIILGVLTPIDTARYIVLQGQLAELLLACSGISRSLLWNLGLILRLGVVEHELGVVAHVVLRCLRHTSAIGLHHLLLLLAEDVGSSNRSSCPLARAWEASFVWRLVGVARLLQLVDVRLKIRVCTNTICPAATTICASVLEVRLPISNSIVGRAFLCACGSCVFHSADCVRSL